MGTRARRCGGANTLVIEVTNKNAIAWLDLIGNFLSPAADVVERLTMIDHNVIYVTVTVEDPNVFTRPWALAFGLRRNADPDFEMWENAVLGGRDFQSKSPGYRPQVVSRFFEVIRNLHRSSETGIGDH